VESRRSSHHCTGLAPLCRARRSDLRRCVTTRELEGRPWSIDENTFAAGAASGCQDLPVARLGGRRQALRFALPTSFFDSIGLPHLAARMTP
jgi:hypothetical protein